MTANGWLQIFFFLLVVFLVTKPLGGYMARVFGRERTWLDPVMRPLEKILYKVTGVDESHEMDWKVYALALILFSGVSMIVLYV
ncbi:MAG: potassium-transporting ATPase subunit KdpA, partial [Candidatus Sulfotelmatobacter sp.]